MGLNVGLRLTHLQNIQFLAVKYVVPAQAFKNQRAKHDPMEIRACFSHRLENTVQFQLTEDLLGWVRIRPTRPMNTPEGDK